MLGDTAILHIWHIVGTQKIFVEGRKPVTSEEVKTVISRFFQINFLKYKWKVWEEESGFKFIEVLLLTIWTLNNLNTDCLIFDKIWLPGSDWYFALSQMFYFIHPAPKSIFDLMWTCVGRTVTMLPGRLNLKSAKSYGIF